jgi:hypothetical protein
VLFTTLLTQGKLYQHCAEIENQARNMLDTLVEQMKVPEGVTEHLKEQDQLEWVQRMRTFNKEQERSYLMSLYTNKPRHS